jgi:hypothetical protein
MVEPGARHLLFLSPSAGARPIHNELIHELESMGCSVQLVRGSVSDLEDVKKSVAAAIVTAPLKGVYQMSMVLRDQTFSRMTLHEWNGATWPKIQAQ